MHQNCLQLTAAVISERSKKTEMLSKNSSVPHPILNYYY